MGPQPKSLTQEVLARLVDELPPIMPRGFWADVDFANAASIENLRGETSCLETNMAMEEENLFRPATYSVSRLKSVRSNL